MAISCSLGRIFLRIIVWQQFQQNLQLQSVICFCLRTLCFSQSHFYYNVHNDVICSLLSTAITIINESKFSSRSQTSEILHSTWFSTFAEANKPCYSDTVSINQDRHDFMAHYIGRSAVDYFSFLFYLLSLISSLHCPTSVGFSRRSVRIILTILCGYSLHNEIHSNSSQLCLWS